jgi:uncharacterized SAM-binding protein YcdF (DUF218 family)
MAMDRHHGSAETSRAVLGKGGQLKRAGRNPLFLGFLIGLATVFSVQLLINNTPLADLVVRPLVLRDAEPSTQADAIVILGAGLNEACGLNRSAIARIIRGSDLYLQGRAPWVLITGGVPGNAPCAIADAMARFAVRLGVPASKLLIERVSTSTFENAAMSDSLLRGIRANKLLLVTDRLHMLRSESLFRCLGYTVARAGVPVHETETNNMSMLFGATRETAALAYYWWNDSCSRVHTNSHIN